MPSAGVLLVAVDERRLECHPVLVQGDDVNGPLYVRVQCPVLEYDIGADCFVLRVDAVHGRHGVVDSEEGDPQLGMGAEHDACELSGERRAATEPEHDDAIIRRRLQCLEVPRRLLQYPPRVAPVRRGHHCLIGSQGRCEYSDFLALGTANLPISRNKRHTHGGYPVHTIVALDHVP